MANQPENIDQWEACPAGELSRMVQRVDAKQRSIRRRQVVSTGLLSTAVVACVVFVVGSMMSPSGNFYGGIRCSECRSHFAEYYPHAAGKLVLDDADLVASMQVHLEKCTFCREKFAAMYPDLISTNHTPASRPATLVKLSPSLALAYQPNLY